MGKYNLKYVMPVYSQQRAYISCVYVQKRGWRRAYRANMKTNGVATISYSRVISSNLSIDFFPHINAALKQCSNTIMTFERSLALF